MNVIHKGTVPEDLVWEGKCHNCKSVVQAKSPELKITHCQKDGTFGAAFCPVCDQVMHFYKKET